MNELEIVEQLNKAENIIDKLRADILNGQKREKTKKKESKKAAADTNSGTYNLQELLLKYYLPIDKQFIEDLDSLVRRKRINPKELESCLARVRAAQQQKPKDDLKKYIFRCVNNIKYY